MAKQLTDRQKKKIIADYVELGSYNAVAKKHKVSATTVKRWVLSESGIVEKCEQKKAENTQDMLEFLASRNDQAKSFIDMCFAELTKPEKLQKAQLQQITTAMGTVIDKFTTAANPETNTLEKAREILGGVKSAF